MANSNQCSSAGQLETGRAVAALGEAWVGDISNSDYLFSKLKGYDRHSRIVDMRSITFGLLLVLAQGQFIHADDATDGFSQDGITHTDSVKDGYSQVPRGYDRRMTATVISSDTIQIQFKASWTSKRHGIERAVLLRSAKEASKLGFQYFKFIDLQNEGLVLKNEVVAIPGPKPEYFTCSTPDTTKLPRGLWNFFIKCFKTKTDKDAMESKTILTYVSFQ